jgi:hypothetical protein
MAEWRMDAGVVGFEDDGPGPVPCGVNDVGLLAHWKPSNQQGSARVSQAKQLFHAGGRRGPESVVWTGNSQTPPGSNTASDQHVLTSPDRSRRVRLAPLQWFLFSLTKSRSHAKAVPFNHTELSRLYDEWWKQPAAVPEKDIFSFVTRFHQRPSANR